MVDHISATHCQRLIDLLDAIITSNEFDYVIDPSHNVVERRAHILLYVAGRILGQSLMGVDCCYITLNLGHFLIRCRVPILAYLRKLRRNNLSGHEL